MALQGSLRRRNTAAPRQLTPWAQVALAASLTPIQRLLVFRLSVPPGQPLRYDCESCGANVELRSTGWPMLLPTGRCGMCRRRGGAPHYLLELVAVGAAITAAIAAPSWPLRLAALWWVACAVPLVFIDLRVHRLPNALTYSAAAGVGILLLVEAAATGQWEVALRAGIVAATTGALFLVAALLPGSRGVGLGDGKMMVSVALLLSAWGWASVFAAVFVAFIAAGVTGGILLATGRAGRHEPIPMGPFIVAGAVAVLALQAASAPL